MNFNFLSIIITLVVLSILVIVHEFGHYLLARRNGVFVKEFSVGFGPKIISKKGKNGTVFALKAIPFGGACVMKGAFEDEAEESKGEDNEETEDVPDSEAQESSAPSEDSFESKSVWARMSIILAGPVFNFFLAFILAVVVTGLAGYDPATVTSVSEGSPAWEAGIREGDTIVKYNGERVNFGREIYLEEYVHPITSDASAIKVTFVHGNEKKTVSIRPEKKALYRIGISYYNSDEPVTVETVEEGTALAEAGIKPGDVITAVNGTAINSGSELALYFGEHAITDEPINVAFTRRGGKYEATIYPKEAYEYSTGFTYNIYNVKANAWQTIRYSFAEVRYQIRTVFKSLGLLFSPRGSLDMLSGPVGIVEIVNDTYVASAKSGFLVTLINLLNLMVILSANLGVVNLLPIPALDGGKFILLVIEAIRGKPIERKYEGIITLIGAILVILLAVVVLINDVTKFF